MEKILLDVPYFSQHDNLSGQGYRECFSSSCAMLAAFHGKVQSDDEYNQIRADFGDTTNHFAHLQSLKQLGLNPVYRTNGTLQDIYTIINGQLNCPVAVGWLHKGHVKTPTGGGHWSVVAGIDHTRTYHHDPYGEADLVNGGYVNFSNGKMIAYSHANWLHRWMPEGEGTGWYLYCVTH